MEPRLHADWSLLHAECSLESGHARSLAYSGFRRGRPSPLKRVAEPVLDLHRCGPSQTATTRKCAGRRLVSGYRLVLDASSLNRDRREQTAGTVRLVSGDRLPCHK
jgi:hypothetical protein